MVDMASLIGSFRRIGTHGPPYEVLGPAASPTEGEALVRIRLIESGEEVDYPAEQVDTDPSPDEDPVASTLLTLALPEHLDDWLRFRLAQGLYLDAGEYIRDLVRRDRERMNRDQPDDDDVAEIRSLVDEGLTSGVVEDEPHDVIARLKARDALGNG